MRHGEHRRTDPRGAKAGGHDPGDAGQGGERVPADHLPLGGGPRHAGCGDAAEAVGAAGGQLLDADGDRRAAGGDAARPATDRACVSGGTSPGGRARAGFGQRKAAPALGGAGGGAALRGAGGGVLWLPCVPPKGLCREQWEELYRGAVPAGCTPAGGQDVAVGGENRAHAVRSGEGRKHV